MDKALLRNIPRVDELLAPVRALCPDASTAAVTAAVRRTLDALRESVLSGEADIKRAMADCADESYLLFDGSKFDRKAFSLVFSPEELHGIAAAVTDCEDARCRELFERVSAGYIIC